VIEAGFLLLYSPKAKAPLFDEKLLTHRLYEIIQAV
jgi:hypothetical protein